MILKCCVHDLEEMLNDFEMFLASVRRILRETPAKGAGRSNAPPPLCRFPLSQVVQTAAQIIKRLFKSIKQHFRIHVFIYKRNDFVLYY